MNKQERLSKRTGRGRKHLKREMERRAQHKVNDVEIMIAGRKVWVPWDSKLATVCESPDPERITQLELSFTKGLLTEVEFNALSGGHTIPAEHMGNGKIVCTKCGIVKR